MINERVRIHDKFSVEIKLGYNTRRKQKINDFVMNAWFFVPNSLDVNRFTYSKELFYNDLKSNIRFTPPTYLLRDLAGDTNTPIRFLTKCFTELAQKPTRKHAEVFEYQLKMFQAILRSSLYHEISHISKNVIEEDSQYLISSYIENISMVVQKFRALRRIINTPTVTPELLEHYLLADEFMSNTVEQYSFRLLDKLKKYYINDYRKNKLPILALIKSETDYRIARDYPVLSTDDSHKYRETVYRQGVLRKYIESQLFLSTRKKKDGQLAEQVIFSIAAGVAMIFATGIAFYIQQKYGNFTLPLFIALVISYMLKDRMKELARHYFGNIAKKYFYDHKFSIEVKKGQRIGWSKESFSFVREEKVPSKVLQRRNRSQIMKIENQGDAEKVIHFRKFLRLNRKAMQKTYKQYDIIGVNDIVRFNIAGFTQKMDNPEVPIYELKNSSYSKILGEKVYYLNMVINFRYKNESDYRRYRIVFNRKRIIKVEKL